MEPFKEISRPGGHRTELEAVIAIGARREIVRVSVVGRDLWAYQMAKVQLQQALLARRRAILSARRYKRTSSARSLSRWR